MNRFKQKKYMGLLCASVLLTLIFSSFVMSHSYSNSSTNRQLEDKRILLISSYGPSFMTFYQQIEGIKSQLDASSVSLDVEFMDSKRFSTEENKTLFLNTLTYKLKQLPVYDVILVSDDNALKFVMEHRLLLFPATPIVFLGINDIGYAEEVKENKYITGVIEAISLEETIDVAIDLYPKAKKVVALVDDSTSGQGDKVLFEKLASKFPNHAFEILDATEIPFERYFSVVGSYDVDTIFILLSLYKDLNGKTFSFYDSLEALINVSRAPIFHPYLHGIGEGLVGGKVISHYSQGAKAGALALGILKGESPSNIPLVRESPNVYTFDMAMIEKWGMNPSGIPKDSVVINARHSIFEKYKGFFIFGLPIFVIQTGLIVALFRSLSQRKRMQQELVLSKGELMRYNEELEASNEELIASFDEIQAQGKRIYDLVYFDELTGLSNRYAITNFLEAVLKQLKSDEKAMIFFLDIDNFKNINDTYGHDFGDEVIRVMGGYLKKLENAQIKVGRFGGDEFLVSIYGRDIEGLVMHLVEDIKTIFNDVVEVKGRNVFISVSIGISTAPQNALTVRSLIQKADMALYVAKSKGKNRHVFYSEDMETGLEHKVMLQGLLKEALKNDEFYMVYQPYFNMFSGEVMGFEALLRWKKQEALKLNTLEMVELLEEMGYIVEVGDWILNHVFAFVKHLIKTYKRDMCISVNVSSLQLMSVGFVERLIQLVQIHGVNPRFICLEMTETIMIQSMERGANALQILREQNFKIAIDDFGTGYSSLKYFKLLPLDVLKLDKSFVDQLEVSAYDQNLIEAMILLSHQKNVQVIAEGVENSRQIELLKNFGCDVGQGYFYSKPIEEEQVLPFLTKHASS